MYYSRWGLTSVLHRAIRMTLPAENLSPEARINHLPLSWSHLSKGSQSRCVEYRISCLSLLLGVTLISIQLHSISFAVALHVTPCFFYKSVSSECKVFTDERKEKIFYL